jgi:hypothetical protein
MSFLKNAQHRLGFHTGDWTFDQEGACDQSRNCTGCGAVTTRVQHELSHWTFRIPRETNGCTKQRGCQRCRLTETRQEHSFEWYYYSDARQGSGQLAAVALAHTRVTQPCRQFSACVHCGAEGNGDRTRHVWSPPAQNARRCVRCAEVDNSGR